MSSNCIKKYMDGFYTSRSFQRYQVHPNRSLYDKVMVLRSWSKNRGLQQRRHVGSQRRDVAETEHPDVATLQKQSIRTSRRCCTTSRRSGLVLSGLLAHFEPIMEGFKSQTVGIERRTNWNSFLDVFDGEQAPFGWKHLGLVLGEISRVRSWKRKNT